MTRPTAAPNHPVMDLRDLAASASNPASLEALVTSLPVPLIEVRAAPDGDEADPGAIDALTRALESAPCVLVAGGPGWDRAPGTARCCDVVLGEGNGGSGGTIETLVARVAAAPLASVALVTLLRGGATRSVAAGLLAESAVYSALQAGPEFARWIAGRRAGPPRPTEEDRAGAAVRMARDGGVFRITLSRPHVHNAFDTAMRDGVSDALHVALTDAAITTIELHGDGPSFCSGGDLAEFGSRPDPATAHVIRLTRSPARLMAAAGPRVSAFVHGACMGAGIELAAFAHTVVAAPDTRFALPEIGLGLVPGAGGTVSLPRRIGRQRTAGLALSGVTIDANTALAWGLVDAIADVRPAP